MVNEDMPFYRQFPNACGLTSLLMLLKPPSRKIDEIFDYGWQKRGHIFKVKREEPKEYRWQRMLEYLLTASTQLPVLRTYLLENFPNFKTQCLPWLEFNLFRRKQRGQNLLTDGKFIMNRVYTMKHDPELKVLAYLFGCPFIPWEKCVDSTSAVFFSHKELLAKRKGHSTDVFEEKYKFLAGGIERGGPVLWGASFHWLAVRDISGSESITIHYHDPMGGGDRSVNIGALRETDRFYVFDFHQSLLNKHVPLLKKVFSIPVEEQIAEVPVEGNQVKEREE